MSDEVTRIIPGGASVVGTVLAPGSLLLHTYEVERLIAHGGMGEVYLVRHCELGTRHAIKVIRPQPSGTEAAIDLAELFRREAAALSSIRHEAVVGYEGFFRDGKRSSYLVMEYVAGPSLAEVLRERTLAPDEVYRLRDRVAGGLAAAHERGVTHRDLAPDNIILLGGEIDRAKVIDFGIAKLADSVATTIIGNTFAGKLRFAAPEQLGLYGGKVGPSADLYSLALVLAAAAGVPLCMGDTLAGAVQARLAVPDLTPVPAWLRPQLAAMLAPDPAARPASLDEVRRRWPRPAAGRAHPVPATPRRPRRRAVLVLPALGALALILGWLGYRALGPPALPRPSPGQEAPATALEPPVASLGTPAGSVGSPAPAPRPEPVPAPGLAPEGPTTADSPGGTGPAPPQDTAAAVKPPPVPAAVEVQPDQRAAMAKPSPTPEAVEAQPERRPAAAEVLPPAPVGARAQARAAPKPDRPAGQALAQPRASGGATAGRCQNLLLKAQLGEPLSGADRAVLASCR